MDSNDLLTLSNAVEVTKPLATRDPHFIDLRRSCILLRLAVRAARRQNFGLCRNFINRAIPGFSIHEVPVSGALIGVYNHLGRQLQAA